MKRKILAILLALGMILTLAACGGSSKGAAMREETAAEDMVMTESSTAMGGMMDGNYLADMKMEAPMEPASPAPEAEEMGGSSVESRPRKLIRTAWLELETTEFETAVQGLTALTEQFGGYFENSSVANRGNGSRWGNYTVRVPAEQYEAFLNQAGALCHETWRETSQEDVSEAYYDTAGRLKTQQIKLERLQTLLAEATAMEDIITIESAISETEWNIDSLSGTLRRYDGQVDYATVHVTLNEVYKLSNVEEVPDTFGQRLGRAFGNGMRSFVNNVEDFVVWVAYNWIGILIWGAVIAAVVTVVRKRKPVKLPKLRRSKDAQQKNDDKQDEI